MIALAYWTYGAGFVAWLVRLGYNWDTTDWLEQGPMPVLACLVWPLALPVALGKHVKARKKALVAAAKERQKWLEAKID